LVVTASILQSGDNFQTRSVGRRNDLPLWDGKIVHATEFDFHHMKSERPRVGYLGALMAACSSTLEVTLAMVLPGKMIWF